MQGSSCKTCVWIKTVNSAHVKEKYPSGVTGLWLSAWYAGRLGSEQKTQSGIEALWVCAPLAICTRVGVTGQ